MSVREKINQSKSTGYTVAAALLVLTISVIVWSNSNGLRGPLTKIYFSDDDGKSYFVDSVNNVPPFDHNGKEAVQAFVYRAGGNPPFVGYLMKYPPSAAKNIRELLAGPQSGDITSRLMEARAGALVKKPGGPRWFPAQSGEGNKIATIEVPAGQTGDLASIDP